MLDFSDLKHRSPQFTRVTPNYTTFFISCQYFFEKFFSSNCTNFPEIVCFVQKFNKIYCKLCAICLLLFNCLSVIILNVENRKTKSLQKNFLKKFKKGLTNSLKYDIINTVKKSNLKNLKKIF